MKSQAAGPAGTLMLAALVALVASICGCTTTINTKRAFIAEAMDAPDDRRGILEATLRVLDENPEYVQEMFHLVRRHPKSLNTLLEITADHLEEEKLAKKTAAQLVKHPESVYQVMVSTLEASEGHPEAQEAIARAIEERAALAAQAMTTRPGAVETITAEMSQAVVDQPEARAGFLRGMATSSGTIAEMLANSPPTLSVLVGELMRHAARSERVAEVIMSQTAGYLDSPRVLRATTELLAEKPEVLEKVMIATMRAARSKPLASHAIAAAIGQHPALVTEVITRRPESVYAIMVAMVDAARRQPAVREAMMRGVAERRQALIELILSDPETAAALGGALVAEGIQSTSLADRILDRLRGRAPKPAPQGTGGSGEPQGE